MEGEASIDDTFISCCKSRLGPLRAAVEWDGHYKRFKAMVAPSSGFVCSNATPCKTALYTPLAQHPAKDE
eukprot:6255313-Amphidinium_carterae.1